MDLLACTEYKSPNYNIRKNLDLIDTVIIHYTGMRNAKTALNYLCNKKSSFIFATHFHELINIPRIKELLNDKLEMYHMSVQYDNANDMLVYKRK